MPDDGPHNDVARDTRECDHRAPLMLRLLLPALIPSWRFFDRVGPSPRVEYAIQAAADDQPPRWREVRPRPARVSLPAMLARLAWNPDWNEALYLVSCAERLLEHPSEVRAAHLVSRVAAVLDTDDEGRGGEARVLRVRVVLVTGARGRVEREVAFVSEPWPFGGSPPAAAS